MSRMPNTQVYFGTATKAARNLTRKDFKVDYSNGWKCQVLQYFHHHTTVNPFKTEDQDPEELERNRIITHNQILNYILHN